MLIFLLLCYNNFYTYLNFCAYMFVLIQKMPFPKDSSSEK